MSGLSKLAGSVASGVAGGVVASGKRAYDAGSYVTRSIGFSPKSTGAEDEVKSSSSDDGKSGSGEDSGSDESTPAAAKRMYSASEMAEAILQNLGKHSSSATHDAIKKAINQAASTRGGGFSKRGSEMDAVLGPIRNILKSKDTDKRDRIAEVLRTKASQKLEFGRRRRY
jgi:hypothetical protein